MRRLEAIDLNLLLLMHWLMETQNVSVAAKHVGLSQPAASRGLRRLRNLLDDEILIRVGRTYTLSPYAKSVRGDLSSAIIGLRNILHKDQLFEPEKCSETIRVASNDYLSALGIEAWMEAVTPVAPKLRSSWRPLDLSVIPALMDGEIDFIMASDAARNQFPQSPILDDMVTTPLLSDRFVLFAKNKHPLFGLTQVDAHALADFDHILVSPAGEGRGFLDNYLEDFGLRRTIRHRTASFHHAADLALTSDCIVTLPERFARMITAGTYCALPVQPPALTSFIAWHVSRRRDPVHSWFRRKLIDHFATG